MKELLDDFFSFLNHSPTAWHAAKETADRLLRAGFTQISEEESWQLEKGKGYFVIRDGSAIAAFRLPKKQLRRTLLLASHLDSPSLKIKPIAEVAGVGLISQFFTEVYGSPLLHTWFDRDLALAGRIVVKTAQKLETKLVFLKEHPLCIPSLAPHFDRTASEKGLIVNKQDHLRPIASLSKDKLCSLETLLKEHTPFDELIASDLFLAPLEKASFLGPKGEMIASARLDNLSSAYASIYALLSTEPEDDALQMALFFDHEEIGSNSCLGAESTFLGQTLERIALHEEISGEALFRFKNKSWCISADLAHGYHPNFADRFDPKNAPWLGDGVVLKTSAQKRYATSASSAAPLIQICRSKNIPLQMFASKSDISGGNTLGSIVSAVCGIPTVDIGISGWAMHSIRETVSTQDQLFLCQLLKEVLQYASKS